MLSHGAPLAENGLCAGSAPMARAGVPETEQVRYQPVNRHMALWPPDRAAPDCAFAAPGLRICCPGLRICCPGLRICCPGLRICCAGPRICCRAHALAGVPCKPCRPAILTDF